MFRIRCGNASSSAGPTRRMNPARHTGVTPRAQVVRDRAIVGVAIREVARADDQRLDPGVARALKSLRVCAIGDHDRDRRRELARRNRVDNRLEIAAAPEDQDARAALRVFHRGSGIVFVFHRGSGVVLVFHTGSGIVFGARGLRARWRQGGHWFANATVSCHEDPAAEWGEPHITSSTARRDAR